MFCYKCSRHVVQKYVRIKIPCPYCGVENEIILCNECALMLANEILQQINRQSKPD